MSDRGFSDGKYYALGKYLSIGYSLCIFAILVLVPEPLNMFFAVMLVAFVTLHLDAMYGMKVQELENQLEDLKEKTDGEGGN